jgi:hypothetical protein
VQLLVLSTVRKYLLTPDLVVPDAVVLRWWVLHLVVVCSVQGSVY